MKRKFWKWFFITIIALSAYSFFPVLVLYLEPDMPICTNDRALEHIQAEPQEGEVFGFIVLGDNHSGLLFNDTAFRKMVNHINRENRYWKLPIDFVMIAGDITYRGKSWDYRIFNKLRSMIRFPVLAAIGNHDDDEAEDVGGFHRFVGKEEFSFVRRNCYFIVADTSRGEFLEKQFGWLEAELKKSLAYPHRFIIVHKSPVSPYQRDWYRPELNSWSIPFMKLCEKYKVDVVFAGHEHLFKEQNFGGVKYLTTGGGSTLPTIPDWDGGFLHYLVVRVHGDYVDYELRRVIPPFWELITAYAGKDLLFLLRDIFL